jgi:hypothetical protein
MSDKQDERLEEMLRSRRVESASPDLAQRIILKARQTPQLEPFILRQWLTRVFAEFHLPNPAYVLAGTLVMGFVLGLNVPAVTTADDADTVQVQSFLYSDEGLL